MKQSLVKSVKDAQLKSKIAFLQKHYIRITLPQDIGKKISDIIGMESEREELGDALEFLKHLKKYQHDPVHAPHSRFLMAGASGSGKTVLVAGVAKEANCPLITVDISNSFVSFFKKSEKLLNALFFVANSFSKGCVMHIQNLSALQGIPAERLMLFHSQLTQKIAESTNTVIVLSTIENEIRLPKAYFGPNAFYQNKVIQIMPPTLPTRKALFEEYFKMFDANLAPDVSSERLARCTLGMYPKDIEFIVRETIHYSRRKHHESVSAKDFNDVMLAMEAGQTYNQMNEKERRSTAIHEAGHVIAAYYSNPDYILGRVEITPRAASLGLTQEEAGEEKFSMFESDCRKQIIYSFGGMAAEEYKYGETTSGVTADLSSASALALMMFQNFGMDSDIGPIAIDDDYGFCSEDIFKRTENVAREYLKRVYGETLEIIKTHALALEALAEGLLEHEVLMGDEIKKILVTAEPWAKKPGSETEDKK